MPRGGPRPGAGAPGGNLNAIKDGRYSRVHHRAALIIAAVPELRQYLHALLRAYDRDRDRIVDSQIALALAALAESPALRKTIKSYVSKRLRSAPSQLQNLYFAVKQGELTTLQSNRALIQDIEATLAEPECPLLSCCQRLGGSCRFAEFASLSSWVS